MALYEFPVTGSNQTEVECLVLKQVFETEQILFQKGNVDGQQAYENVLSITNYQGNASQNNESTSYLSAWLSSERTQITSIGKDLKKTESLYTAGGSVFSAAIVGNSTEASQKTKTKTTV